MGVRYVWGKYTSEKRYYYDYDTWGGSDPGYWVNESYVSTRDRLFGMTKEPTLDRYTGKITYIPSSNERVVGSTAYSIDTNDYPYALYATVTGSSWNGPSGSSTTSSYNQTINCPITPIADDNDDRYILFRRHYTNTDWSFYSSDGYNVRCQNGRTYYDFYVYEAKGSYYPDEFQNYVSSRTSSSYPSFDLDSDGYFYYAEDQDNIDPDGVTIPDLILYGDTITITVDPSGDAEASNYGTISYRYERSVDGGQSWQLITTTPNLTQTFKIPDDATKIKFRVRAQDNIGYTSADYVESKEVTISAAGSLAISGEDKDLGTITSGIDFYVSSEDVTEALVTISTSGYSWKFTAQVGQTYTIDIFDLVNGSNTVAITATSEVVSGTLTATRTYQYTKAAQEFETGDAYAINQNGSIFYPLLVAEGVKLSDGRTLDVALSSIMERLKQIEQQAS